MTARPINRSHVHRHTPLHALHRRAGVLDNRKVTPIEDRNEKLYNAFQIGAGAFLIGTGSCLTAAIHFDVEVEHYWPEKIFYTLLGIGATGVGFLFIHSGCRQPQD